MLSAVRAWSLQHSVSTLLLVTLVAVVVNCYPVIFCGRSFVSPAWVPSLVYDRWPPMPGMEPGSILSPDHGSDVYAMMWWDVPLGFLESRSLLDQGELPLWNRYSHAGAPLLGQGVSMLGDPLQLIVIAGRGSTVAWDLKFLIAKFIFCLGFGLLIRKLIHSEPLSWAYAGLGAYCGAYFFIANHPAFFVFAYVPWILLSAMELLDTNCQSHLRWGVLWLTANIGCFNGGHLEVAVDLVGGLNLATLAHALVRQHSPRLRLKVLGRMAVATLLFLGLTAPVWISFLVLLSDSYTAHASIKVEQQPLQSLPGAFDPNFYRDVWTFAPGTSLLVLSGVVLSALNWRQFRNHSFFWVNTAALFVWGGFVFGWIPGPLLAAIPLLNRVGHVGTDFSYLLVVHLTIQSAYGFKSLAGEHCLRAVVVLTAVMLALLLYSFLMPFRTERLAYLACAGTAAIGAPALYCYLKSRYNSVPIPGYAAIICLGFISQHRFGLYNFGDRDSLMVPGPRVALNARSQALDKLVAAHSEPFRTVGLPRTLAGPLSGDYSAVYGLEDIRSCAPMSGAAYIDLVRHFPGMSLQRDWVLKVNDPQKAQPLLSLLNVKYLLANPSQTLQAGPEFSIADRSDFLVLQNLHTWPRAFFVNRVTEASTTAEFIDQLREATGPFASVTKQTLANHLELRNLVQNSATVVPATNYRLAPNSTAFHVQVDQPGLVCLTEEQAKDFSVTVNRQAEEVLTVNRAFKGVYLARPGEYDIRFSYRPRYWGLSCGLFCVCLSVLVAGIGVTALRSVTNHGHPGPVENS